MGKSFPGKLFERSNGIETCFPAGLCFRARPRVPFWHSHCHVIYRSAEAAALTEEQLSSARTVMLDENTRLHRKEVSGGFVYWQDDITQLNRINTELAEMGEHLAGEVELLRLQNELQEEWAQIEARSKTYDTIAAEVLPQSRKIAALCSGAERDPSCFGGNKKAVCLLGAYIKRYANLSLIAADQAEVEAEELYLAISESLRQLDNMGVPVVCAPPPAGALPFLCCICAGSLPNGGFTAKSRLWRLS